MQLTHTVYDVAEMLTGTISVHASALPIGLEMIVPFTSDSATILVTRFSAVLVLTQSTAMPVVITHSEMITEIVNASDSGQVNSATSISAFARTSVWVAMDQVCTNAIHVYHMLHGILMDVVCVMLIGEVTTVVSI